MNYHNVSCQHVNEMLTFPPYGRDNMPLTILDPKTFKRINDYAEAANVSIDLAIVEAVNEFMDTTGDLLLAEMKPKRKLQPL